MLSARDMARDGPVPLAPFETWPVQQYDPGVGSFCWYARPAVFVTQTTHATATLLHAKHAAAAMDHVLAKFQREIDMHGGLLVLHDWRSIVDFDAEARKFYTARIDTYKKGVQRGAAIAIHANPIVHAILQLAAIAVPFRTGHAVRLMNDLSPLLAEHNVEPLRINPFADMRT